MDGWTIGLVVIVVLGLAAIVTGALVDRRRTQRAREQMLAPPERPIPHFDPTRPTPQYLSELQARRPPTRDAPPRTATDRDQVTADLAAPGTVRLDAGFAAPSFVTDEGTSRAVLDEPAVLVCDEPVGAIRELLPVLERTALSGRPLVLVAPAVAAEVLSTLEVNVIQRRMSLVAVLAPEPGLRSRAALAAEAVPVSRADLQSGYLEAGHLGHCRRWVSTRDRSFVITAGSRDAATTA